VDIVAVTSYSNTLEIAAYRDMLAYGKPIAVAEYGPTGWGDDMGADGSLDNRLYIARLATDYPRIAYFSVWNSWAGVEMALPDNLHASELMNDPRVITRDRLDRGWASG
jgi:hypothetical protein